MPRGDAQADQAPKKGSPEGQHIVDDAGEAHPFSEGGVPEEYPTTTMVVTTLPCSKCLFNIESFIFIPQYAKLKSAKAQRPLGFLAPERSSCDNHPFLEALHPLPDNMRKFHNNSIYKRQHIWGVHHNMTPIKKSYIKCALKWSFYSLETRCLVNLMRNNHRGDRCCEATEDGRFN